MGVWGHPIPDFCGQKEVESFVLFWAQLLLDVSLVVGRCRLLGEELRLLQMWGGLKLDILNISCVDTL